MMIDRIPTLPASTRAVDLVREHHGLLPMNGVVDHDREGGWAQKAHQRHLHARRRLVRLSEIPESQYPVILEIRNGTTFVVLTAKTGEKTYGIQFPDSREADVSAERLEEFYDGRCVFLKPRRVARGEDSCPISDTPRRKFRNFLKSATLSKGAFGFNLVALLLTCLMIYSHEQAFGGISKPSLIFPLLASGIVGIALVGVIGLRRELFRHRVAAGWMDMAFVPVFLAAATAIAGWPMVPILVIALLLVVGILGSDRLGSVRSGVHRHWKPVVLVAFVVGSLFLSLACFEGVLSITRMNGALGISTYAIYLIAHGGNAWQSMRLAMSK